MREVARWLCVCAALSLPGASLAAQGKTGNASADTMLQADAERRLDHPAPRVRGEAALAVAAAADPRFLPAILKVAQDEDPTARAMGLLALGRLGAPGCETLLVATIAKSANKPDLPALAAAYALGQLPAEHGSNALNDRLAQLSDGSYKRQQDVLLALVAGLLDRGGDDASEALLRLAKDAALRDPSARAAVLTALAPSARALDESTLGHAMRSESEEVRRAAIGTLLHHQDEGARRIAELERMTKSDASALVRAAALEALTAIRHLPALELATQAVRSKDQELAAQGVRTMIRLGGDPARRELERQFRHLGPLAQRALLDASESPVGSEFLDACRDASKDPRRDPATRSAAILALARTGQHIGIDEVVGAFAGPATFPLRCELAAAFRSPEHRKAMLAAASLDEDRAELQDRAVMLAALLRVQDGAAQLACARLLQREGSDRSTELALRALRCSRLVAPSEASLRFAPAALKPLLAPR